MSLHCTSSSSRRATGGELSPLGAWRVLATCCRSFGISLQGKGVKVRLYGKLPSQANVQELKIIGKAS